jgi:hypothetical protein
MAKHHDGITGELAEFVFRQPMFFVATAPQDGRINVSPKGLDGCFRILGPHRVAFLNLTGSGNETAAHLRQNGRITFLFCSFGAKPMILRLYGTARALHRRHDEWAALDALFPAYAGKRQIIVAEIASVITSCGFGVPLMDLAGQRTALAEWSRRKGQEGIEEYWREKNVTSFDGLPTGLFDES